MDYDRGPKIVSPVMRFLGVADVSRSVAFYRDVLGFEIRENEGTTEAVGGPARLQFGKNDYPPNDWENPLPAGSSSLFFETEDIVSMHATIAERGGKPSAIERVNWIKMSMFELRDPDGHVLWFGQSYNQPDSRPSKPMFEQALPWLAVTDVETACAYYRDALGFRVSYQKRDLAVMDRDCVTMLLIARTERHTGIGSASFYVRSADELHAELLAKGARIRGEPVSQPWGLRTFEVVDLEGNELSFGQPFE